MRSAVDTNVISALLAKHPAAETAEKLLFAARSEGAMVICGPVYAELLAQRSVTVKFLDDFLLLTGISLEVDMGKDVWERAGLCFKAYAQRRKESGGGDARRILADFVIGAHAGMRADRLLTFDREGYELDFPDLVILDTAPSD